MNYARIYFEVPLNQGFDYEIPKHLLGKITPGLRVLAPFGSQKAYGYCVELLHQPEVKDVKQILDIPDPEPLFSLELMELAKWIAQYYFCPLGLVLKTMVPSPVRKQQVKPLRPSTREADILLPPVLEAPHLLNEEQRKAWDTLRVKIHKKDFGVSLIHGITGSGKTELYLFSIQEVLNQGRGAIVLVPEISLTPQTVFRVRNRFGCGVALLHSRMSTRERIDEWDKIRKGDARVVVGPRSALFSPVKNLGLIIVDEEHERSYKQEESPKYHARDVAIMRAKINKIPVILGTATPALESYFNAERERYDLITLLKRVEDRPLPKVRVIDMRREGETYGKLFNFSRSLIDSVSRCLKEHEQMIVFLNRRGYAPLVLCPACGHVLTCSQCDQAMSYHRSTSPKKGIHPDDELVCHLCDTHREIPKSCEKCKKGKLHRLGVGTQRVEAHLMKLFPGAKIQRMDTDSTRTKDAHQKILEAFQNRKIEILVGTQMVAKGLDFPNVTLVGVMSADVAMSLPDFRMGEHTFQLLTQVAGRAGRGQKLGEVLIQTFTPMHPIIRAAVDQDYGAFYKAELKYRKELAYPPFSRIISMLIEGKSQNHVVKTAHQMSDQFKEDLPSFVRRVGPHAAPIEKIKNCFRWQIILFSPRGKSIHDDLKASLSALTLEKGIRVSVDVDPVSLI